MEDKPKDQKVRAVSPVTGKPKGRRSRETLTRLRRWFFGVVKEFRRIKWMSGKEVAKAMAIVVVTTLVLIALLAAVDAAFLDSGILG